MNHEFDFEAEAEYTNAAVYYEEARDGLGERFVEAVELTIRNICDRPDSFRLISPRVRRGLVRGFPYGVLFAVASDRVYVLAVMHLHRKPGYWSDRLKRLPE